MKKQKLKSLAIKVFAKYFNCSEKDAKELNHMTIDCMVQFGNELVTKKSDKSIRDFINTYCYSESRSDAEVELVQLINNPIPPCMVEEIGNRKEAGQKPKHGGF